MYKTVVGLEVHCELETLSKMFSPSRNDYSLPNTNLSVIDLSFPGVLPVVNKEGVRKALMLSLALNCTLPKEIEFDRKNYFYPDLPKGYQITQMEKPFGINGELKYRVGEEEKTALIHDIHLEEDSASLEHYNTYSYIDYNRAGIPLVEIVTEPCFTGEKDAIEFLETLRNVIRYCKASSASSEKGQIRCDVNVSVMKDTDTKLGTRTEIKNVNSFSSVADAITYESKRQIEELEKGNEILQETRRWIDDKKKTETMRKKEDAIDYKYFTEPNIPSILIEPSLIEEIKSSIPVLPYYREQKYINEYNLTIKDSHTLVKDKELSDYFEECIKLGIKPQTASNWINTKILGYLNKENKTINEISLTPNNLYSLTSLIDNKTISSQQGKEVFDLSLKENKNPSDIVKTLGLEQISDEEEIRQIVIKVLKDNPNNVEIFKNGKENILGFFIGQILKESKGKANPTIINKILNEEIRRI
ncbi:MAG: Asp-tRNA(Asn)/Glu-tRNA(Gln) amidotransferase subunit GatB [Bacilli bacterium]